MKNISIASIHPVPSGPSIQDEDLRELEKVSNLKVFFLFPNLIFSALPSFSEMTKEPKVEANAETATNYSRQIGFVIPDNSN